MDEAQYADDRANINKVVPNMNIFDLDFSPRFLKDNLSELDMTKAEALQENMGRKRNENSIDAYITTDS